MLSDPKRLLDRASASSETERNLLQSLHGIDPPTDAAAQGWQSLAKTTALAGTAAGLGSTSSASQEVTGLGEAASNGAASGVRAIAASGSKLSALKALSAVVLVGGATTGVIWSVGRTPTTTSTPATVIASAPPPPANIVTPEQPPTPVAPVELSTPTKHATTPKAALKPAESPDLLTKESELVVTARAQLRQGDVGGAGATLQELDRAVPHGKLAQEREVLRIEWLAARGDRDAAARRARAFLTAHPKSPHAARLSRFVD